MARKYTAIINLVAYDLFINYKAYIINHVILIITKQEVKKLYGIN